MRKVILCLSMLAAISVPLQLHAQQTEEFKPSGKLFGLFYADFQNVFTDGGNVSVFEVTRSYLGYDYSFSKTISGRLMFDAASQSVSGKSLMAGYLRNAYIQFDNGKFMVRGGIMESEHISHESKFWNYRYISKAAIDNSGAVIAADIGLMAKYTPSDKISIDLGILNGRGFKDITADTTFKFVSGVSVSPVKNILLRGYFDMMGKADNLQWTASLTVAYINSTFSLGAEYFLQKNHLMANGDDYSGSSIFSSLKLKEKFSVFARYDNLFSVTPEGETEPWNLNKDGSRIILGFDYSPVKNIRIAPNFNGLIPKDEEADFTGVIGLNVEAKF